MKIALTHFRAGETDRVSLEMEKWKIALECLGHEVLFIAGSKGTSTAKTIIIPELHDQNTENLKLHKLAFGKQDETFTEDGFEQALLIQTEKIENQLIQVIESEKLDLIIPNNMFSLGFNLPVALALYRAIIITKVRCLCHHHDFHWERELYNHPSCSLTKIILNNYFPPKGKFCQHVVINKIAQDELLKRKQLKTHIVPNVFDFKAPAWKKDDYNQDFREAIGLKEEDILVLQATRIVKRKGIEMAIDLISKMREIKKTKQKIYLTLAGSPEAEGNYITLLKKYAAKKCVKLLFINDKIASSRYEKDGKKYYSRDRLKESKEFIQFNSTA